MTETTTIPTKEDNITPVDLEKKPEVKQEPEVIQPENEASDSKPEDNKVKEIKPIDNGYLQKSSKLLVMKHWSRSYFAFGSEGHPISIPNLKTYHRKNVKKGIPKPNVAGNTSSNAEVKDDEPSKVDDSTKVEESKKPEESPKVDESPKVVDESPKVDESKKPDEPPKVEESTSTDIVEEVKVDDDKPKEDVKEESDKKQVDDKKSPETKDEKPKDEVTVTPYVKKVFENIAHASQTGEGLLFYFKSETHQNIPHGIINLKDVKDVLALNEHSGKQFAFKIETEYRTFELAADKEEDRESWIKTIKEKSDKVKESPVTVDESKFNETYEKLVKGTAFTGEASKHAGELSDEPFSGDEETADKSRSTETNKRKSFLPFAFGRKSSTNEPIAAPIVETTEDDSRVVTENTTEETEENKTGEPKSPLKASKFLSFFNKKPESTQSTPKADEDKAKPAEETTNAETSNTAAATTNGAEHPEAEKSKKFNVSDFFTKKATSGKETKETKETKDKETKDKETKDKETKDKETKETPKDENKEVTEQGEQTESAATDGAEHPEAEKSKKFNVTDFFTKKATSSKETPKEENKEVTEQGEQTESKPETTETPADETAQQKEGSSFFKNIFKKGETSETAKTETTEPSSADVTTTEAKNDGNKETEETTDTHDAEDKAEPSLVRRVTTKIFGGKRAKSPKADEKKSESISRDLVDKIEEAEEKKEETEEKKEETEETKPTENADATAQTSEQITEQTTEQNAEQTAGPESSTETENKKKEKSSIFSNFGRRKSGGVKKENSESQDKAETDEAVASATEATDVEEPKEEKTEKANQKPVFPDEKRIKKSGNLQKQCGFIAKSFEQRYFVLTDDKKLFYYRNNNDATTQKSIDILKVKIGDGNKFDLETKSRTYKLSADSEEDRESWIKVFRELGFEVESHESTSESKEPPKKLDEVVPSGSGNENDLEKSVKDAADKSADTADAKVTEIQETTTQSAKVEESTEEITVTTESTEIQISS